jgi:hypothetical protein
MRVEGATGQLVIGITLAGRRVFRELLIASPRSASSIEPHTLRFAVVQRAHQLEKFLIFIVALYISRSFVVPSQLAVYQKQYSQPCSGFRVLPAKLTSHPPHSLNPHNSTLFVLSGSSASDLCSPDLDSIISTQLAAYQSSNCTTLSIRKPSLLPLQTCTPPPHARY